MSGRVRENRFVSAKAAELPSAHAKRLAWALKNYGQALAAAVRRDTSAEARRVEKLPEEQIPERVGRIILERADPTLAKTMTGWLVKQYAQGGLRLEDTGTANETLDMFQRYAPQLPEGQRDLGQYQSLAEAWDAVFHLAEVEKDKLSHKAQKALDRDKAYAESRILRQDEDGFTIAVPLTEFAAKWWGKGTRWCTAAEKDNQFWRYNEQAPLIVILIPELKGQGKFQLWVVEEEFEFMDAADKPVSNELILKHWSRFERILTHVIQQNGLALKGVPKALRTEALCKIAVAQDGLALEYVPPALLNDEMHSLAVARNGWALVFVPENLRTEELYKLAVAQNGGVLRHVPMALRTDEVCRIAVTQDGSVLECVPKALRSEAICSIAVAQNSFSLAAAPEALLTESMYRAALAQNGWALQYVPQALRTEELCAIAVSEDGRALAHVPLEMCTKELCNIAVAQHGLALAHVPKKFKTKEMFGIAVAQDGRALRLVPPGLCAKEMCEIAVAQNGVALEFVPPQFQSEELYKTAVAQNGWSLKHIPEALRSEEMCSIAVKQDGEALMWVPQSLHDQMRALIPTPPPVWDFSLLEDFSAALAISPPSGPLEPQHA